MTDVAFRELFDTPTRNGLYKAKRFQGHGISLVKMKQLFGERRIRSRSLDFEKLELTGNEKKRLTLMVGDLLFSRTSVVADGVGLCSIIDEAYEPLTWDSNIIRVRLRSKECCPEYFFYYFNSPQGRDSVKSISSGAAVTTIRGGDLSDLSVPNPPLPTQRKIASILSAYDDLIENNTRRIAILEEMAQAIYREWFVNFRFPGHENVKLVDSPLGQIPEGWNPTTVGDLAVNERRSIKPQEVDPETPYVGLEHIPRKSITMTEWGFAADIESTKHRFCEGEILFGKIRPYFHKVVVAPFDGICSSDAIVIVPRKDDYFPAVLCCVSSVPFVDHATQTSQGTKMPRANWDILTKYPLPLPTDDLLGNFNEVVNDIVSTLKTLMRKNRNLRTTRDLLLPKLISGKLDVQGLDIDVGMTAEALEEATT